FLASGGGGLIVATNCCEPAKAEGSKGYRTAYEARAAAQRQLRWYYKQVTDGLVEIVTRAEELPAGTASGLKAILLMEGADPFCSPEEVSEWFDAGLRIVGLAWKRTRMAGGTGEPGPLTEEGKALVKALDAHGIIHDASHLAEESFWQLLEFSGGPVMASHSNCRAIVPTDRQLSDDMIRAIVARGGVVGINFFDKFLIPPTEYGRRRAGLADVVRHIQHV